MQKSSNISKRHDEAPVKRAKTKRNSSAQAAEQIDGPFGCRDCERRIQRDFADRLQWADLLQYDPISCNVIASAWNVSVIIERDACLNTAFAIDTNLGEPVLIGAIPILVPDFSASRGHRDVVNENGERRRDWHGNEKNHEWFYIGDGDRRPGVGFECGKVISAFFAAPVSEGGYGMICDGDMICDGIRLAMSRRFHYWHHTKSRVDETRQAFEAFAIGDTSAERFAALDAAEIAVILHRIAIAAIERLPAGGWVKSKVHGWHDRYEFQGETKLAAELAAHIAAHEAEVAECIARFASGDVSKRASAPQAVAPRAQPATSTETVADQVARIAREARAAGRAKLSLVANCGSLAAMSNGGL